MSIGYSPNYGGWPAAPYPAPMPLPNPAPIQQNPGINRVSGIQGAQAFNMAPNSEGLFLDSTQPAVWLKTTDAAGYPTLTGYHLVPMTSEEIDPQPQVKQIEAKSQENQNEIFERLDRIERMLANVSTAVQPVSEPKYTKSDNGGGTRPDQKHDRNS